MIKLRYITKIFLTLLLVLSLANCSRDRGPTVKLYDENGQISATGTSSSSTTVTQTPLKITESGYHTVKKEETLFQISRDYQVPLRSIIEENKLNPPYNLVVGQRLYIPIRPIYKVRAGDTVYRIAKNNGVSMNELVRVNNLKAPYQIYVGQDLIMPGKVVENTAVATATESTTTDSTADLSNSNIYVPEQNIPPAPVITYGTNRITNDGYPRPYPKPFDSVQKLTSIEQPAARSSSVFLWPVKGKLISGYGAKGKGLYNDGLNIAAPKDSPIKAAENGVVAYAGTELKGYGNLILIKHADGFLTAYAHNSINLVKRGEKIKRGQIIAKVGTSGNVDSPQLHFQIRQGKQTVNPMNYLGNS